MRRHGPRNPPPPGLLWAALCLSCCLACGKRGDPLPPLRPTPQPVTGLTLSQRGDRLEISVQAPRAGADGTPLRLVDLEILRADGEGDFASLAKRETLKAAPGELLSRSAPLPAPGTLVRVTARASYKGRPSTEPPPLSLTVRTPLAAPTGLSAALAGAGVELRWSGETTESGGFRVYRRSGRGAFGAPLAATPVPGPPFSDTDVAPGQTLCYAVRSVASTDPLVESVPSQEACIDFKDVVPPPAPGGLTAVVEGGAVSLSWSPVTSTDLAAYRVYRSSGNAAPERLAELPASETRYRDSRLPPGELARYSVTAVDAVGNESEASGAATARLP